MATEDQATNSWHLDKRVPLALIVTLLIQSAMIVWWARGIDARVEHLDRQHAVTAQHAERIIRLEEKVGTIKDGVDDIKSLLRRMPADLQRRSEQIGPP